MLSWFLSQRKWKSWSKHISKGKVGWVDSEEPTKSYSETVKSHAPNPSKSQTKPASHKSSASSVGSTGQSQAKPEYPECSACGNKHPNSCWWRSNGHPDVNKSSKSWRDSDHGKQYKALQHWHLQRGKRYDEGSKSLVFWKSSRGEDGPPAPLGYKPKTVHINSLNTNDTSNVDDHFIKGLLLTSTNLKAPLRRSKF